MTNDDVAYDLQITKISRRENGGTGTWVTGRISDHRFDALVFPEHAENPEYELGQSRISKLWVRRNSDKATVLNFDRGWDVRPTTEIARQIADFLAAGLADHVFA
jgi:hypothetical protein